MISIHALREEGDSEVRPVGFYSANFYPRPPRGGRLDRIHRGLNNMAFLSTPSARRATVDTKKKYQKERYFYPRPPRGGRPVRGRHRTLVLYFYPRPPRGGRRQ